MFICIADTLQLWGFNEAGLCKRFFRTRIKQSTQSPHLAPDGSLGCNLGIHQDDGRIQLVGGKSFILPLITTCSLLRLPAYQDWRWHGAETNVKLLLS